MFYGAGNFFIWGTYGAANFLDRRFIRSGKLFVDRKINFFRARIPAIIGHALIRILLIRMSRLRFRFEIAIGLLFRTIEN